MAVSNEVIKEHKIYKNIKANLEEAYDHIHDLEADRHELLSEHQYLSDFIHHKGLTDEFQFFKAHAHLDENEDVPFHHYVL